MRTLSYLSVPMMLAAVLAWPTSRADEIPEFSHAAHLEEGAECTTCHQVEDVAGLPGLKREACADCHDEDVPQAWRLPARARQPKVKFPHGKHVEAVENCSKCHAALLENKLECGSLHVEPEACFACHAEEGVEVAANNCRACHGRDMRQQKPSFHDAAWARRHGRSADWQAFANHQHDCQSCHRIGADCQSCHRTTRPRSHNALWRMRGHGLAASFDRDSCRTCHETGSCVHCHRSTPPLNHKGAWRSVHGLAAQSRSNQHCATCHNLGWCAACHAGGGN